MISDREIEREQARAEEALERRDQKMEERCGNCRFWKRLRPLNDGKGDEIENDMGLCRRLPPVVLPCEDTEPDSWFTGFNDDSYFFQPVTQMETWCGEWQPAREPEKQEGSNA